MLTSVGRLERGNTIALVAKRDTTTIAASGLTFTADPAANAQVNADGSVKLLASGRVSIIAHATNESDTLDLNVAAPPTIIVDRLAGTVRAIYRASLDGLDTVRISSGIHDDVMPTVASGAIVFTSFRDGNAELYSVPLAGGTETRLTATAANETSPSLSPTAPKLAYVNNVSGFDRLWMSASNGGGAAPATNTQSSDIEENPRWNPSGDKIVFVSTAAGSASLYLLTPASGAIAALTAGAAPNVDPAWSFDGATIVFFSARSSAPGLYLYSSATNTATLLFAAGDVGQPSFLRDGRVVFTRFATNGSRLQWIDPADPTTVHEVGLTGSPAHAVTP
ncbi:MAG TPA: hypothetical protein VGM50_08180 [Gemmatimonadaceae bacterium]